jgi:AcrR family transcriptional regulator
MTTPLDRRRPPRLNKRQQQAVETRERMLRAATDVFAERGYQAASVGAITTRADTAHGTFYLYFRNKEDAFVHVMKEIHVELYEVGARWVPGDPRTSIEASIRGFLEVFMSHRGLWRCLLEASFANPVIEAMWRDARTQFTTRVERILANQVASGTIRPLDPALTASSLGAMVEWEAVTEFVLRPEPASQDLLEACVATLTDLWYHAIYVRPPEPDEAALAAG